MQEMIQGSSTAKLLELFELTTGVYNVKTSAFRWHVMDELEKRHPKAFRKWLEAEYPEDQNLRKMILS